MVRENEKYNNRASMKSSLMRQWMEMHRPDVLSEIMKHVDKKFPPAIRSRSVKIELPANLEKMK